ncbi:hypothetical protein [Archangium lipolyticum]|uniref:hypothetical protein n=1 Tax=Archangium lipolyticum TaxID=2970465 RepID=UPI002149BCED|nr:hypothetical protein [Archangium lipolyticum]
MGQRTRVVGALVWLLVAGCQTPGAMGSGGMSASNSNSGDSSGNSNSGDSSGNSNSGDSGSGDSGNSSQSNSGESTQADSSQSNSSQSESSKTSGQTSGGSSKSSEATSQNSAESSKTSSESSKSSQSNSGSVVSVTTIGATVGGLGLIIWQALKVVPAAPAPAAVGQAAQVYLRARTHQLREDLALGAGPTIEDLAAMARIRRENLRVFGRLLREHRTELLTLADSSALTPERAIAWLERVGQLARTEPRLDADRRAFLASHGVVE